MEIDLPQTEPCPVCADGTASLHYEENKVGALVVGLYYRVCDRCCSEYAGPKEAALNKQLLQAAQAAVQDRS